MDSLQKRISRERDLEKFYIEKSIFGTEAYFINNDLMKGMSEVDILEKRNTLGYLNDILEKGAAAGIGEIRNWNGVNYRKLAPGKWVEVSERGMTKKEHEGEKKNNQKIEENQGNEVSDRRKAQDEQNKHHEAASKLSDKEYDDTDFEEKKEGGSGEQQNHEKGDKVKFYHAGLAKDKTGKIIDYREKNGKIVYDIKIDGTTNIVEDVPQFDIGFKKSHSLDLNQFEKGKKANIGEIRVWNGKKFRKVAEDKWEPVTEKDSAEKENKKEDVKSTSDKKESDKGVGAGSKKELNFEGALKIMADARKSKSHRDKIRLIEEATKVVFYKIRDYISDTDDVDEKYKILEGIESNNPLVRRVIGDFKDSLRHSIKLKHF